mmetsp:Transcript_22802/g.76969  ORF Transcript_22802/g.76969 Transcript_22802/m.76969 type:complete len:249 (+) Transcript_22802:629-1375(+)
MHRSPSRSTCGASCRRGSRASLSRCRSSCGTCSRVSRRRSPSPAAARRAARTSTASPSSAWSPDGLSTRRSASCRSCACQTRLSTPAWRRVSPPSNARSRREAATTTASASATSSTPAPATSPAGVEQGGVAGGEHTRLHETARGCTRSRWSNGVMDAGRPAGMALQDFVDLPDSVTAGLRAPHVAALRLYTSNCFRSLNTPLRSAGEVEYPFPVTLSFISDAIRRLRAVNASQRGASESRSTWRARC